MGLADIVRGAIATADSVTKDLQPAVQHRPFLGTRDEFGNPQFGADVELKGLVEYKNRLARTPAGDEIIVPVTFTYFGDLSVTLMDEITLPSGITVPVRGFKGFVDPLTGRPYMTEVYCGVTDQSFGS